MTKYIPISAGTVGFFLPFLVFAQGDVQSLIATIGGIISKLIPLVVALALLYFFWGLARFILNAGGGKEQEEAKAIMLWGIIALFVMISVWGIVRLLGETLLKGVNSDAIPIDRLVPDSFGPNNPLGP